MQEKLFQGEYVSSDRMLYTPSEFAKSNLMYLQEIGALKARKTHASKRQNLDSFLFFYVKEGSGTLDYNGREYMVKTGDCVFINCKNPYLHRTSEDLWALEWIHFNGDSMLPIYLKYVERGGQPVFQPGFFLFFSAASLYRQDDLQCRQKYEQNPRCHVYRSFFLNAWPF